MGILEAKLSEVRPIMYAMTETTPSHYRADMQTTLDQMDPTEGKKMHLIVKYIARYIKRAPIFIRCPENLIYLFLDQYDIPDHMVNNGNMSKIDLDYWFDQRIADLQKRVDVAWEEDKMSELLEDSYKINDFYREFVFFVKLYYAVAEYSPKLAALSEAEIAYKIYVYMTNFYSSPALRHGSILIDCICRMIETYFAPKPD